MNATSKGYLKSLKRVIDELDLHYLILTENEKETFLQACRAYATYCEPMIASDRERLDEARMILQRVRERAEKQ